MSFKEYEQPIKVQVVQPKLKDEKLTQAKDNVQMESKRENLYHNNDEEIIQSLPKTHRKKGKILQDFLKTHPDQFSWNQKGEMIYQGKTFYGSNMCHLLSDVLSTRKKPLSQTFHGSAFLKALSELDVPGDLIKNVNQSQMLEVYKNEDFSQPSQNLSVKKKQRRKEKWLSSTSQL